MSLDEKKVDFINCLIILRYEENDIFPDENASTLCYQLALDSFFPGEDIITVLKRILNK